MQTQTPISTQISHPQPDQPTTINQNQPTTNNQNKQPPKERERERDRRDRSSDVDGDDDGDDDVDDWSGLANAACASDDDDDGNDSIGVASPKKMICFSSDPIGVSFCSFSVEGS